MPIISDQTWQQLDPYAGALPAATRRRWWLLTAVGVLIAIGAVGLVAEVRQHRPEHQLGIGASWGRSSSPKSGDFTVQLELENHGAKRWQIESVGQSGPGLELTRVEGVPAVVPAGTRYGPGSLQVVLHYRVTDCRQVPVGQWQIPVRVGRAGHTRTIRLDGPMATAEHAPADYSYEGTDPWAVGWQRDITQLFCHDRPEIPRARAAPDTT